MANIFCILYCKTEVQILIKETHFSKWEKKLTSIKTHLLNFFIVFVMLLYEKYKCVSITSRQSTLTGLALSFRALWRSWAGQRPSPPRKPSASDWECRQSSLVEEQKGREKDIDTLFSTTELVVCYYYVIIQSRWKMPGCM